jgi:hypothetical protein
MASTRNKNTPGNYCQDHRQNIDSSQWLLYKNWARGIAYDTKLPGRGFNPGQMPWNTLSNNSADIESFLFGINSTNLVNPAPPLVPELKCLSSADLFERAPVYMPMPFNQQRDQRPSPLS